MVRWLAVYVFYLSISDSINKHHKCYVGSSHYPIINVPQNSFRGKIELEANNDHLAPLGCDE